MDILKTMRKEGCTWSEAELKNKQIKTLSEFGY